jgi:hypothetical protein
MRTIVTVLLMGLALTQSPPAPKPGAKIPGVKIPIERLQPDAVFPVPGSPDWIAVDEDVWISNKPKDNVARLGSTTNIVAATIQVGARPCSGLAAAFGPVGFCCRPDADAWISERHRYRDHPGAATRRFRRCRPGAFFCERGRWRVLRPRTFAAQRGVRLVARVRSTRATRSRASIRLPT